MKVFKEEQRFTQLWLIVLMAVSLIVPVTIIIKEYNQTNSSLSQNKLIGTIIIIIATALLIFTFKLTTRIDEKGIYYQFFPFHLKLKLITWQDISKAYVRNYSPISDYGGWGLKGGWSSAKGKAINVSGDVGIQLELKTGKKLLIGTQKENEAKSVLATYASKINLS
ncbi:hypothetical protein KO506_12400 [Polaribacter vadi]|uniref:hypothetical protein n=1 Tax=Polaribacter TaxID=52959 RepID=UPI001C095138|nr:MULTISPECIES: hypothetical protein [Polaribacter]MBU3012209.1 hypothetical protein [Polaribacter vadi]MDO6742025.1 hypothetical protein [Polaribacter sp. 1_MG-2023]